MKSEAEIQCAVDTYSDMVRRICFVYLKNEADCEDIFQDVYVKYATSTKRFEDAEHLKAWMIRVSINRCKDWLKRSAMKNRPLEEVYELPGETKTREREILTAVTRLPENYRTVVYLHYYEGYTAPEIGKLVHKKTNTVYTWLGRARDILRVELGGEADA